MTEFDFSSILIAKTDGDVCGPDGCLPGEEPTAIAENPGSNESKKAEAKSASNMTEQS